MRFAAAAKAATGRIGLSHSWPPDAAAGDCALLTRASQPPLIVITHTVFRELQSGPRATFAVFVALPPWLGVH